MDREMREQPAVLAALLGRRRAIADEVARACPDGLAGVLLLARGSSDNAAVYARYALELASGGRRCSAPPACTPATGRPPI
jgi:glutamine---fructose-6-phosphate transaminase (isomerizing)